MENVLAELKLYKKVRKILFVKPQKYSLLSQNYEALGASKRESFKVKLALQNYHLYSWAEEFDFSCEFLQNLHFQ